ncbi:MAG: alpha/beta hydrolase [Flavobacterium sp. BFFFF2]|nr:MAG: alpha/beta hydrolase [Flavobacterium sp. BFFFF2]
MEQLYARVEGEGQPLLIIHGFLGMSDNWKTLSGRYATLGFQVHVPDMRNHGRSFHSDQFSYELMVQDVLQYMDAHQLSKVAVIGHSMGGKVAMLLATQYPDRVSKLIVADIGPKYYAPHHQAILAALSAVDFSRDQERADVEKVLRTSIHDEGTLQFLLKNVYRVSPSQLGYRFHLHALVNNIEEIGQALPDDAKYTGPVLFVRGGKSNYVLDADCVGIQHHFPQVIFKTIDQAGHWIHAEQPQSFFECTARFLQQ